MLGEGRPLTSVRGEAQELEDGMTYLMSVSTLAVQQQRVVAAPDEGCWEVATVGYRSMTSYEIEARERDRYESPAHSDWSAGS